MDADFNTALRTSWEANAAAWTRAVRDGRIESRKLVTDQAILGAVTACAPAKVLDLGCGEGWLVRQMQTQGIQALGIDASAELIAAAQAAGGDFRQLGFSELVADPGRAGTDYNLFVANFALLDQDLTPLLRALHGIRTDPAHLLIQTLHPHSAGGAYLDGWRSEDFAGFGGAWQPMPWYFRTLGSWIEALITAGWQISGLHEPLHPQTGKPASLLLRARA